MRENDRSGPTIRQALKLAAAGAVVQYLSLVFGLWMAFARWGSTIFLPVSILLHPLLIFGSLIVVFIGIDRLLFSRDARYLKTGVVLTLSLLITELPTMLLASQTGYYIRIQALKRVTRRLSPVIVAINEFEADNGHPPAGLSDLVPKYLKSLPKTGIRAFPRIEYKPGSDKDGQITPWSLAVPIDYDRLVYLPDKTYDQMKVHDKIGEWAYYGS